MKNFSIREKLIKYWENDPNLSRLRPIEMADGFQKRISTEINIVLFFTIAEIIGEEFGENEKLKFLTITFLFGFPGSNRLEFFFHLRDSDMFSKSSFVSK